MIEAGADIVGVITKKESNYNSDFRDLVPLCETKEIPYELVENINEEKVYKFIENIQPEIAFCFGWSQLIKDNIIKKIPQGIIGFHPAALPKNRGRHPIIWALVLGLYQIRDIRPLHNREILQYFYSESPSISSSISKRILLSSSLRHAT